MAPACLSPQADRRFKCTRAGSGHRQRPLWLAGKVAASREVAQGARGRSPSGRV